MTRPLLIDLFCKAGGAAKGYYRAGFDILGVDIDPQPNYPYPFERADVWGLPPRFFSAADAVHASPECQGYTLLRHAKGAKGRPQEIGRCRSMLQALAVPYVIENVQAAAFDMIEPIRLCGSMFGLGAQGHQLQRHRLFESNIAISAPGKCAHTTPVIGVYGGHARNRAAGKGGRGTRDVWEGGHGAAAGEALGIDWMTLDELSEAIPPAFTEHLGRQLLAHIQAQRSAA